MTQDEELDHFRATITCDTILLNAGWRRDEQESTRNSPKFRRGAGEIIILSHKNRGWWDPTSQAKGDIFAITQHIWGGTFGDVRIRLRAISGTAPHRPSPSSPESILPASPPPFELWSRQPPLTDGNAWNYLREERKLPDAIIRSGGTQDVIKAGSHGTAWFKHSDNDGIITGWEMRGPKYRGFTSNGHKSFFRYRPSFKRDPNRIVIAESAISVLSLAALERRADTLYLSCAGQIGPSAQTMLIALLTAYPNVVLAAATDNDAPGDKFSQRFERLAADALVYFERVTPTPHNDWNDVLKTRSSSTDR
jgi:hypothetical protein